MTINFNGGIHEVLLFKDGVKYDVNNFPALFRSIQSVEAETRALGLANLVVNITPNFSDAVKILESGLLGIGITEKGQSPELATSAASGRSVTPVPVNNTVSSPKESSASDLAASIYPVLAVRFLYVDQTDNDGTEASTPWFVGMINVPDVNITGTDISITLKAYSNGIMASKFITTASFSDSKVYDAITELIKPYGLVITFDEDDDQTENLLKDKFYSGTSAEPPMMTVKNILLQIDCYFTLTNGDGKKPGNEIRIKSRKAMNEGKIDFTFVLWRQIDPANNVIPIYDFSLQSNGALFLAGGAFGSKQTGVDSSTKKVVTLEVDDKSNKTKGLSGNKAGMNRLPGESQKNLGVSNGVSAIPANQKISGDNIPIVQNGTMNNKGEIESKALTDGSLGLTYNITVPGLPRLSPLRLAQVIVGDNIVGISGPGQIWKVTHRTGSDGWVCEIEFKRQPGLVDGVTIDQRKLEAVDRPTTGTNVISKKIS